MIDLHTHSTYSDGTDSVPELIWAAQKAGLKALALTDHDTMDGVAQAQWLGASRGIEILRGMELSTHVVVGAKRHSVHLLAYGCQPSSIELWGMVDEVRESRRTRLPRMLECLAQLGFDLDIGEVEDQSIGASSIGRPHVADAMVARGWVANRSEAFDRFLGESSPAYVQRHTPSLVEALAVVNRAGGVGVIAHPWARGNRKALSAVSLTSLTKKHGLVGLEVDHVDHDSDTRGVLAQLADDLGLLATGSSDYHGQGKTGHPLGVCTTPLAVYQALKAKIKERGGQP
ncbi:MAG: PHP domain-containing protein [Propionibacteriaceae bacterium]|jgi:predicted metal-dependent phosphoesterase TrpH|nr:PHP domain-containing protein [Propionibacteriaceae bacterium]